MEQATAKPTVVDLPGTKREGKVYNFELTFNLGKTAQGRFLTDFPQSMAAAELREGAAMLNRQARILQAGYDLEQFEEELENREAEQAQHRENRQKSEEVYLKERARLTAEIAAAERKHGDVDRNARQSHANSNRRGEFKPDLETRRNLNTAERIVKEKKEARAKLKAERKQANETLEVTLAGNDKAIAKLKARIERKWAVVDARE